MYPRPSNGFRDRHVYKDNLRNESIFTRLLMMANFHINKIKTWDSLTKEIVSSSRVLLGCDAVYSCCRIPTFRKATISSSSG